MSTYHDRTAALDAIRNRREDWNHHNIDLCIQEARRLRSERTCEILRGIFRRAYLAVDALVIAPLTRRRMARAPQTAHDINNRPALTG